MDDDPGEGKKTEFDSSVATLIRINDIIRTLHHNSIRFWHSDLGFRIKYLECLDVLFIEGQSKFTNNELTKSIKYQTEIKKIRLSIKGPTFNMNGSPRNKREWGKLRSFSRNYEIYLMRCLDGHNMLMKTQKDAKGGLV